MVIYCHSMVITKVYNTEWWYYHGMAVTYRGKEFYNIGPRYRYELGGTARQMTLDSPLQQ